MKNEKVQYLGVDFQYGMHACGFIHEIMFTNSLESLKYWYSRGVKIFEVDIDNAGNGEFVACHNFTKETFLKMEIEDIPKECTCEWFEKQKLYPKTTEGLTPMTLKKLFELLCEHSDMLLMIDPKVYSYAETCLLLDKMNGYIDEFGVDGKRIIFETYNEDMIWATREYPGMMQYQHCVDDEMQMGTSEKIRSWDLEVLIKFLKESDIHIVSYPWKFAVENLERVKRLHEEGFIIFSKTRNDIFSDLVKRAGINVNIIDYLVTDAQREALAGYREEYCKRYANQIEKVFG